MLLKIEEEILNIKKFQEQFLSGSSSGNVTINQMNGSHTEILLLYEKKQQCEEILKQKEAIKLINQEDNIIKKENNFLITLGIGVIASILLSLIYFFIRFSIRLKNKA